MLTQALATFQQSQLQAPIDDDDASRTFQTQISSLGNHSAVDCMPMHLPKKPRKDTLVDLANPGANVSAFCRAVLGRVVPDEFWGIGEDQLHNRKVLLENVDRFINLRRFETLTLHDVVQRMKVPVVYSCMRWNLLTS